MSSGIRPPGAPAANAIVPAAVVSGAGKPAPSAVDQLRLRTDVPLSAKRDWYQIGANRTLGSGIRDGQAAHADHPVMAQYSQIPDGPGYRAQGGSVGDAPDKC
jgi:hypothetical protein